jgi:3'(2'), 5'-bisphosphate nucleotidase
LPDSELLDAVIDIARRAGREILDVYGTDFEARAKADDSPLTEADLRAHRLIVAALAALDPRLPVLSEEASEIPFAERCGWGRYWLVDPLDGTKEFVSRNGEFTVNIALVDGHRPALGVVHIPVSDTTYSGIPGRGAWRDQLGFALGQARSQLPVRRRGVLSVHLPAELFELMRSLNVPFAEIAGPVAGLRQSLSPMGVLRTQH